jgi:ankyrin repeat protein
MVKKSAEYILRRANDEESSTVQKFNPAKLIVAQRTNDPNIVDYEEKTKLFKYIERKKWDQVMKRLSTHPEEASIWVSRKNEQTGNITWRLLPLHSALYPVEASDEHGKPIRCGIRAKIHVVEKLLKVYPSAVLARDDQGMTALHLASRNSAPLTILSKLLRMYPKAVEVEDNKGRTPSELVKKSNTFGKERILNLLSQSTNNERMNHEVRKEEDDDDSFQVYGRRVTFNERS